MAPHTHPTKAPGAGRRNTLSTPFTDTRPPSYNLIARETPDPCVGRDWDQTLNKHSRTAGRRFGGRHRPPSQPARHGRVEKIFADVWVNRLAVGSFPTTGQPVQIAADIWIRPPRRLKGCHTMISFGRVTSSR